jgi:hypothetical protein
MERRFAMRYREIMSDAQVRPGAFKGIVERLEEFVKPFAASLNRITIKHFPYWRVGF